MSRLTNIQGQPIDLICIGRPDADISSFSAVEESVKTHKPDIVINTAAYTAVDQAESEPDKARQTNCDGAQNVAKAAYEAGLPVVHISTDYVFNGSKSGGYVESDEPDPQSIYGKTKLQGEIAVQEANPHHVILRTSWVFSDTGSNFLKTMLRLAETRQELAVVADQNGNPTAASEIARGIGDVCNEISQNDFKAWGTYHLTGDQTESWASFARMIFASSQKLGGPSADVSEITTAEYPTAAARPKSSQLSNDKFLSEMPFVHRPLQDCVDETVSQLLK